MSKAPAYNQIKQICDLLKTKPKVVNNGGPMITINGKKFHATHYYTAKRAMQIWKKINKEGNDAA